MDAREARSKQDELMRRLGRLNGLVVAFSGGVDSAFLLASAREALGDKAVAALAVSPIHPRADREEAIRFATDRGIELIRMFTGEMDLPEFVANGPDRCYHCKAALCAALLQTAGEKGLTHVAHGANVDDLLDYRPGLQAAKEAGIMAPLIEVGLGKGEIRFLAREMGLPQWDRPAMACLATRFPYGSRITEEGLRRVACAEEFLSSEGITGARVRHHGDTSLARIEVDPKEIDRLLDGETRRRLVERLRSIGFDHVALDLEGYVQGKMNRGIQGYKPSGMGGGR